MSVRGAVSTGVALVGVVILASCASGGAGDRAESSASAAPACPTSPVDVVVSVDQWGSIVTDLGGNCATVHTVLAGSSVNPHDYEPAPADAATFKSAQLVVINGGHYDEWAAKLAASAAASALVIDAVDISAGQHGGHGNADNPHVWYDPATVTGVADAVTAALTTLAPEAGDYFSARRAEFAETLKPYDTLIGRIKAGDAGKTYAATEGVFDDMATAVGLSDLTPPGYAAAARNETDPAPADLDAMLKLLQRKGVDVLIFNSQTEGSVPDQIRSAAQAGGVPVVDVTETVAPGAQSFEAWQVQQLTALAGALGVAT